MTYSKKIALKVHEALIGNDFIFAGGGARDTHHGIVPKDYDVVFPRSVSTQDVQKIAENLKAQFGNPLDAPTQVFPFVHSNGENPSDLDRVLTCVKVQVAGVSFDLLRYNVDTASEAIDHFDFSLNQFLMDGDGNTSYVGKPEDHPRYGLKAIRGDHSEKRGDYMQAKWEALYGEQL